MILWVRYLLIVLSLSLLSGCGGDKTRQHQLEKFVTEAKEAAAKNSKKIASVGFKLPEPVTYVSSTASQGGGGTAVSTGGPPLQSYPMAALQFEGTITKNNEVIAYILTPDQKIFEAKVGDPLGNNYGIITKIDSSHVEVLEKGIKKTANKVVTLQLKE